MAQTYTTYYLEMTSPDQRRPSLSAATCRSSSAKNRNRRSIAFYQLVGSTCEWGDLDDWSDAQWRAMVENEAHRTWVAYHRGAIAGYYELFRA